MDEQIRHEKTDRGIQTQLKGLVLWELVFDGVLSYRDTVERTHGIQFEIRPKEQGHNVPHCHACYGNQNISISLIDFSILAGNIPSTKAKFAVHWVRDNIDILRTNITYWKYSCNNGRPMLGKGVTKHIKAYFA